MSRPLRSNFPKGSYLWAVRNAHWHALGIPEEDCEKPKIAIVNSSSELAACFSHLDQIANALKQSIRDAGGVPFEIRTAAPSDFITGAGARGAYMLGARDLITNDIEVAVEGAQLDGMICLTSCDKTVPGQLMAAARINIPTLMVPCGYQPSGNFDGSHVDIEDVFIGSMHAVTGDLPVDKLIGMSRNAIKGPGVCSGLGTANTMHIVCEALGMALPGTAPVAALSQKMFSDVALAGKRIVEMIFEDLKPRDILTEAAFKNAVATVLSIGGSLNSVKHLQAVAKEAETKIDVYKIFEDLVPNIPVLAGIRPIGQNSIEELEEAGGCKALMSKLSKLLDLNNLTVTGNTVKENIGDFFSKSDNVIKSLENPVSKNPAILVLRGNIAKETGLIKVGIIERKQRRFVGPAICFWSSDDAIEAIRSGSIQPGQVVVMRGAGVCGGPAMGGGASRVVFALDGAGLSEKVAMLTDGHLSGLVCKGLVVAEVSPEASTGGPLGLIEDGDQITIDLDKKILNADLTDDEWEDRRKKWKPMQPKFNTGWLQQYRNNVSSMSDGAVLIKN